jgi:hypothetical protein
MLKSSHLINENQPVLKLCLNCAITQPAGGLNTKTEVFAQSPCALTKTDKLPQENDVKKRLKGGYYIKT